MFDTLVIAGCGLLGGSLGMAARARGLARHVVGVGRNPERLRLAREAGAADEVTEDLAAACRKAGLIVLCTPVATIGEQMAIALREAPAGAIVTDVGSTKAALSATARQIAADLQSASVRTEQTRAHFIGSHPMAGSDRSGIEFAAADLYEGATCFVTVEGGDSDGAFNAVARVGAFWRALGCHLVFTTPGRHDFLSAVISHLPHFAAVAVAEAVRGSGETPELLRAIAGNGFRDTTRVAAGDPVMWRDIARSNTTSIREQLATLRRALDQIEASLDPDHAAELDRLLTEAQRWRRSFDLNPEPPA